MIQQGAQGELRQINPPTAFRTLRLRDFEAPVDFHYRAEEAKRPREMCQAVWHDGWHTSDTAVAQLGATD